MKIDLEPAVTTPLREEHACYDGLHWRCDLAIDHPASYAEALEAAFLRLGWRSRCQHPGLFLLRSDEGHEIAWVIASGRIQIRVHASISKPQRANTAQALWRLFSGQFRPPETTARDQPRTHLAAMEPKA